MVAFMFLNCRIVLAPFLLAVLASSAAAAAPSVEQFRCKASANEPLLDQANRFMLAGLRLSPVEATQAGYHGDAAAPLDTQLDDYSATTIAAQRALLVAGKQCFAAAKANSPEDAADLALLNDYADSGLFQLDQLQGYKVRPQDYVEMIGSGLFFPLTSTNGTELDRLTAVVERMEQIPQVIEEAQRNLKEADTLYIDTAVDENSGDIDVIGTVGERIAAGSPLRARYDAASKAALAALNHYATWLKDDLAKRPHTVTWRTGAAAYATIFRYALGPGTHETPDSVLASAERDLAQVRGEMYAVALPLHKQWFPEHGDHNDLSGDALQNKIIAEVIDRINQDHAAPGELLNTVKA